MDLQKIGVKIYADKKSEINLVEFIPVFHRWIQEKVIDDLLIDVADYSHVPAGPGILLIAYEGNYAIDETGNNRGLVYYSKHENKEDVADQLKSVFQKTLYACQLMEKEKELHDRITFPLDTIQIFANDRLTGPNTDDTYHKLEPVLRNLLDMLFTDSQYTLKREDDPKERLSVTVSVIQPTSLDVLLDRLTD
jgi:hypothetical protein